MPFLENSKTKDSLSDDDVHFDDMVPEGYEPPPMEEPETTPWGIDISAADFRKLRAGLRPESQDDKYCFWVTGPDEDGTTFIYIIRFFSRMTYYMLAIEPNDCGRFKVDAFTYDRKTPIARTEKKHKECAVMLCRTLFECDFETLPDYDWE